MRGIIILIFLICSYNNLHAQELKDFIEVQKNLMIIENKINTIHLLIQNKIDNRNQQKNIASFSAIKKAKTNLKLGNYNAAIEEIKTQLKFTKYNDIKNISQSYKILFEAYRMLENYEESSKICSKMMEFSSKFEEEFDDKWKMLCSYSFYMANQKKSSPEFKNNLQNWSNNLFSTKNKKYYLLNNIYISLALKNNINFLKTAISNSNKNDEFYAKAHILLALMNYKTGIRSESTSILKELVSNKSDPLVQLTIARINSSEGQLMASEEWYESVLKQIKNTDYPYLKEQKNKIELELSQVYYKQKKYEKSSEILNQLLEENLPTDLLFSSYEVKQAKLILSHIHSKNLKTTEKSYDELMKLYHITRNDLEFCNKNYEIKSNNYDSLKKQFIPLIALSRNYGINNEKTESFLKRYKELEKLTESIPENKFYFLNSLNSIDYQEYGILETSLLENINQLKRNFTLINKSALNLDNILYEKWNSDSPKYFVFSNSRVEYSKKIMALDDEIQSYHENYIAKKNIYQEKLLKIIHKQKENEYKTKSLIAGANFLSFLETGFQNPRSNFILKNDINSDIFEFRKNQIDSKIFPNIFYSFQKMFKATSDIFPKLFTLHTESIEDKINQKLSEKYWLKIIDLNIKNNNLLKEIENKIEKSRIEKTKIYSNISNELLNQKYEIEKLKEDVFHEYRKVYSEMILNLKNKIDNFHDYIKLSLSEKNRNENILSKKLLKNRNDIKKEQEKWYKSLQQSIDWGLFR